MSSVSFGFKKKIESKVLQNNEKNTTDELEYLNSIDDNVIQSTKPQKEEKELVIPLIRQNKWNVGKRPPVSAANTESAKTEVTSEEKQLVDSAAREIIEESKQFLTNHVAEDKFDSLAVPLLMKNKVPDGFEEDDKLDVSLRPDEASDADYDTVPVHAYGMAVLRGMGWNKNEGIGKTFKRNIKVYEQKIRPKGLGLGASAASIDGKGKNKINGDANNAKEDLELKKNSYVVALKGSHKNKYGIVQGIDYEEGRCIVKLAIGGKSEVISQFALQVVPKKEYEKNSKDISRLSKAYTEGKLDAIMNKDKPMTSDKNGDTDKASHRESAEKDSRKSHKKSDHKSHKHKSKCKRTHDEYSDRDGHVEKKKHKQDKKSSKHEKKKRSWIKSNLRVRIIDSKYRKGKYFKEKVVIEDVLGGGRCCCKTDGGRLLDDLEERMLETVIPRSTADSYIIIVKYGSEHNGKLARLLEKNKEDCTAVVQLIEDRDVLVELGFAEICEYVGDAEAHNMF